MVAGKAAPATFRYDGFSSITTLNSFFACHAVFPEIDSRELKAARHMHILVVEDEKKLAGALQKGLEAEKHSVRIASTGEEAFFLVFTERFDLLLLDIMLPGRDGIEILKALRQKDLMMPVLIVTAKDAIEDRVQGLDAGIVRRAKNAEAVSIMNLAGLEMDTPRHSVSREGRELASPGTVTF